VWHSGDRVETARRPCGDWETTELCYYHWWLFPLPGLGQTSVGAVSLAKSPGWTGSINTGNNGGNDTAPWRGLSESSDDPWNLVLWPDSIFENALLHRWCFGPTKLTARTLRLPTPPRVVPVNMPVVCCLMVQEISESNKN